MDLQLLIVIVVIIGFLSMLYLLNKRLANLRQTQTDATLLEWLKSMQTSLEKTNKTMHDALRMSSTDMTHVLQENSRQLNERLDKAASVIRDVGREVGQMSEIGRNMKELQELLKSPKLRGNIGEEILKDLIAQMLPRNSFLLQYQFKTGDKVDAAIKTDAGILCIDAKFPLENFQKMHQSGIEKEKEAAQKEFAKDVKRHIDAIAKKYILPEENTMNFALMYVPSEAVYYEVITMSDSMDYARKQRVYIVSPNTLYAHLQTILLSFEGRKIESKSQEVLRLLNALQIDYEKVQENLLVLGKHLQNASSQFTHVSERVDYMGKKLITAKHMDEKPQKVAFLETDVH